MRKALLVVPIVMIVGCYTTPPPRFDRINIGMTKDQVKGILGQPRQTAAKGTSEYWEYAATWELGTPYAWYFVRFINDKVESYGNMGDFDSTQDPTQKIIIDKTDNITKDSVTKFDLATELAKLDKLKKDGLISAEDYEVLKKRAIEKAKE